MDPTTLIIVLATHLICCGVLFHLISRRTPQPSGLNLWALGGTAFGLAYLGRLAADRLSIQAWLVLMDLTMVLGALMFVSGLRAFLGRSPVPARWVAATAAAYVPLYFGAVAAAGNPGRHLLLNLSLGLIYLWITGYTWLASRQQIQPLQSPLRLLCALTALLDAFTLARCHLILRDRFDALFQGLFAQIYYTYASLAAVLMALVLLWMVFVRLNEQLAELASRDALTRVLNRNGLQDVVARHFAARTAPPITLLVVDVDHFKRINDTYGHAAGDEVLRAVARTLAGGLRGGDFVARVGGEEFLVGCVGARPSAARDLAERLRQAVQSMEVPLPGSAATVRCTVSIGLSRPSANHADWTAAWADADRALYDAKSSGRNRVMGSRELLAATGS